MNIETISEWMPFISIGAFFVFAVVVSIYHIVTFDSFKKSQEAAKNKR